MISNSNKASEISVGRFYETMVFLSDVDDNKYHDADVSKCIQNKRGIKVSKYEDMIVIFMSIFLMAQVFTVVNLARVANSMATIAGCMERHESRVLDWKTRATELENECEK